MKKIFLIFGLIEIFNINIVANNQQKTNFVNNYLKNFEENFHNYNNNRKKIIEIVEDIIGSIDYNLYLKQMNYYDKDLNGTILNIFNIIYVYYKDKLDPLPKKIFNYTCKKLSKKYNEFLKTQEDFIKLNNNLINYLENNSSEINNDYKKIYENLLGFLIENNLYIGQLISCDENLAVNKILQIKNYWKNKSIIQPYELFYDQIIFILKKNIDNPEVKKHFQLFNFKDYVNNSIKLFDQCQDLSYLYLQHLHQKQMILLKKIENLNLTMNNFVDLIPILDEYDELLDDIRQVLNVFFLCHMNILYIANIITKKDFVNDLAGQISLVYEKSSLLKDIKFLNTNLIKKNINKFHDEYLKIFNNNMEKQKIIIKKFNNLLDNTNTKSWLEKDLLMLFKIIHKCCYDKFLFIFCNFDSNISEKDQEFNKFLDIFKKNKPSKEKDENTFSLKYDIVNVYILLEKKYRDPIFTSRIKDIKLDQYLINQEKLLELFYKIYKKRLKILEK